MTTSWFPIFAVTSGLLGFMAGRRLHRRTPRVKSWDQLTEDQQRRIEAEAWSMSRVQELESACEGGDYLASELMRAWEIEYEKFLDLDQHPWSAENEAQWEACCQRNADYARAWDILKRLRRQTHADHARERDYATWLYKQNDFVP
jgi:hypothetical protein